MADEKDVETRQTVDEILNKSRQSAGEGHQIHNLRKDPDHWVTADDPPTEAQLSFAAQLAAERGEDPHILDQMNKAQVSSFIDERRNS